MITLLLLVRATYMYGVVLHAHPVRGESHIQRNTTGKVATPHSFFINWAQVRPDPNVEEFYSPGPIQIQQN